MKNMVNDLKTAGSLFLDLRKARKAGESVVVKKTVVLPHRGGCCGLYATVEGCTLSHLSKSITNGANQAFSALDYETQHNLCFSPKEGEFVERARFWSELLRPVLTPTKKYIAMVEIINWYIHIKQVKK